MQPIRPDGTAIRIDCDPARLQLDVIQRFLAGSYWARGIPKETVRRSIEGSLCFGGRRPRALREVRVHAAGRAGSVHGAS